MTRNEYERGDIVIDNFGRRHTVRDVIGVIVVCECGKTFHWSKVHKEQANA